MYGFFSPPRGTSCNNLKVASRKSFFPQVPKTESSEAANQAQVDNSTRQWDFSTRRQNTGRGAPRVVSASFEISNLDIKEAEVKPVQKTENLHGLRQQRMGTSASAKSFGLDSAPKTPGVGGGLAASVVDTLRPVGRGRSRYASGL